MEQEGSPANCLRFDCDSVPLLVQIFFTKITIVVILSTETSQEFPVKCVSWLFSFGWIVPVNPLFSVMTIRPRFVIRWNYLIILHGTKINVNSFYQFANAGMLLIKWKRQQRCLRKIPLWNWSIFFLCRDTADIVCDVCFKTNLLFNLLVCRNRVCLCVPWLLVINQII